MKLFFLLRPTMPVVNAWLAARRATMLEQHFELNALSVDRLHMLLWQRRISSFSVRTTFSHAWTERESERPRLYSGALLWCTGGCGKRQQRPTVVAKKKLEEEWEMTERPDLGFAFPMQCVLCTMAYFCSSSALL
jgi:hypothetical protein